MSAPAAKWIDGVYWLALTSWVSVLVAAAAGAVAAFSTLPGMRVSLEEYARFDPDQHGRLAAGIVAGPLFEYGDPVQLVACGLVVLSLILQLHGSGPLRRRPANMVRVVCIGLVAAALLIRVMAIMPRMNATLADYRQAAADGRVEEARQRREEFNRMHGPVSMVFGASLVLLIVAVAASGAALSGSPRSQARPA
jgi:hypothetical protein